MSEIPGGKSMEQKFPVRFLTFYFRGRNNINFAKFSLLLALRYLWNLMKTAKTTIIPNKCYIKRNLSFKRPCRDLGLLAKTCRGTSKSTVIHFNQDT